MNPAGRVVRLARCENVPGFPVVLTAMLAEVGCKYYPEYIVHEQYRAYGQGQFMCQVNFINQDNLKKGPRYIQNAYGIGITVDQAVQEAAHSAIGYLRYYDPYLSAGESAFTQYPAVLDTEAGTHVGIYTTPGPEESASYRALAALVEALDTRARQWYMYAMNARACHWHTLMAIEPFVESGMLGPEFLQPLALEVPPALASPPVLGAWPPRGPVSDPRGSIHQPPYVHQPEGVRTFTGRPVRMSQDLGFY